MKIGIKLARLWGKGRIISFFYGGGENVVGQFPGARDCFTSCMIFLVANNLSNQNLDS